MPVEPLRQLRRGAPAVGEAVHHPGTVRGRDGKLRATAVARPEEAIAGERVLETHGPVHPSLAVIRAEEDRIPLEELIGPTGRLQQRADRAVGVRQGVLSRLGTGGVRGEVVVGEVEDEEVEAVPRDEPAADDPRVLVDRAAGTSANGERRAGHVRLEEVVVEEPRRPEGGPVEPGHCGGVPGRPSVADHVHRRRHEPGAFERLEDRDRSRGEVLLVHARTPRRGSPASYLRLESP